MIRKILFLVITGTLLLAQTADSRGYIVTVGDPCPDVSLTFTNDSTVTLSALRGKVIMLQFTASWCSVCRQEMPHIEKEIWQAYRDQGLIVIGIDRDEPRERVIQFVREMNITYPLALDPGADIFARFARRDAGVTRNVLIDAAGNIAFLTRLYDPEEFSSLKQAIDDLLPTVREE
ncbi:MAG: TlpA family protein disulfide reductase [Fidelibacterota bacterium]